MRGGGSWGHRSSSSVLLSVCSVLLGRGAVLLSLGWIAALLSLYSPQAHQPICTSSHIPHLHLCPHNQAAALANRYSYLIR